MQEYCFSDSCILDVKGDDQPPAEIEWGLCKSLPKFIQRVKFLWLLRTTSTDERRRLHAGWRVVLPLIWKGLGFLLDGRSRMIVERSLWILLLGPCVSRILIHGKGGNVR